MEKSTGPIHKILIVGPSWIGDMVMAQSLFIALKTNNPDVIIDVLTLAWTKPILTRMPEVNQAIEIPVSHGVFGWRLRKEIGKSLQKNAYDQAIVLPNSWKSALIPWFAKIPIRSGWRGEMRYGLLNDLRILKKTTLPMMVQRYVSLAQPKSQSQTAPNYQPPHMIAQTLNSKFTYLKDKQKRLILCPGAQFGPAKQWPAKNYAEVANKMIEDGWHVVILGSKVDQTIASEIESEVKTSKELSNLCGKTELAEAMDIMATADTVVSNDSGLMHIGAALQRNLVAIYGPTSPNFTPPLNKNIHIVQLDIDCGPCFQRECPKQHHNCMKGISSKDLCKLIPSLH